MAAIVAGAGRRSWALKLGAEGPPSPLPDTTTTNKTPTALHRRVSSSLTRTPPGQGNKESDRRGCHPTRDGILARQWLGLGSIHGFSQSQGRDDERRTTNGRRPESCCFRQVPSDAKHQMGKQNERKSAGPGTAQAQHGPWHQQGTDYKRQFQTVLNPGRPIHLRQHRLACAFVHLCALESPALHSMT